jgi:hypothetical protein
MSNILYGLKENEDLKNKSSQLDYGKKGKYMPLVSRIQTEIEEHCFIKNLKKQRI